MTESTLQRIRTAMEELDYRPSSLARGLAMQQTAVIGLVLAEIETPLFLQAVTPIEREARANGFSVLLANAKNLHDEEEAVDLLMEKEVDGLLVFSTSDPRDNEHLIKASDQGVPVVVINRDSADARFDNVNWDNQTGVFEVVSYLVGAGHKRIGILTGPQDRRSSKDRLEGYRKGMAAAHLPVDDALIKIADYTAEQQDWAVSTMELVGASEPPTAIIASDDIVAAVVLRTLHANGINVPADVSVIGIDDQPFSKYICLSTMQLPIVDAGKMAIQLLLERIKDPEITPKETLLPCPLILRDTCGGANIKA